MALTEELIVEANGYTYALIFLSSSEVSLISQYK